MRIHLHRGEYPRGTASLLRIVKCQVAIEKIWQSRFSSVDFNFVRKRVRPPEFPELQMGNRRCPKFFAGCQAVQNNNFDVANIRQSESIQTT